jgi:SAM-dependent methyltransferase
MAKQGEIEYLAKLGEEGIRHAVNKPFSDARCPGYLMQIGGVMSLLPPPPGRLLDVGCGTGWTSIFFARWGYDVVGVDIAPDMIYHANELKEREGLDNLELVVSDYEDLPFREEFDGAVFFDSLHHAVDEELAIRMVHRALRPGGTLVASEPGTGHARRAVHAAQKYNVTEKDMPPGRIIAAGRKAGFREWRMFPHTTELTHAAYGYEGRLLRSLARKSAWLRVLGAIKALVHLHVFRLPQTGLVVMVK